MQAVVARVQVIEKVTTAAAGAGSGHQGARPRCIWAQVQFHRHTVHALTGIGVAIPILVEEHHVAHAQRRCRHFQTARMNGEAPQIIRGLHRKLINATGGRRAGKRAVGGKLQPRRQLAKRKREHIRSHATGGRKLRAENHARWSRIQAGRAHNDCAAIPDESKIHGEVRVRVGGIIQRLVRARLAIVRDRLRPKRQCHRVTGHSRCQRIGSVHPILVHIIVSRGIRARASDRQAAIQGPALGKLTGRDIHFVAALGQAQE